MKLTIVVFFLLLGAFFIISENKLTLKNSENIFILKDNYFAWISGIVSKSSGFVGNIVKLEWLPDNSINENKKIG